MICQNCQEKFDEIVVIDGVKRYLTCRKYCLKCSPFKTRPRNADGSIKLKYENIPGTKEYRREKYVKNKSRLNRNSTVSQKTVRLYFLELLGNKCKNCGYDRCPNALDFHHVNENDKKFSLGVKEIGRKPWKDLLAELSKCILLCANCHREHHCNWLLVEESRRQLDNKRKSFQQEKVEKTIKIKPKRIKQCRLCSTTTNLMKKRHFCKECYNKHQSAIMQIRRNTLKE